MAESLIGLGSNLGDRAAHLQQAIDLLGAEPTMQRIAASDFHATAPVGGPPGQQTFLNAALRVTTQLTPQQLLAVTRGVEEQLGRVRSQRWGPRVIDIDLLLYDRIILETSQLTLPHPRMAIRRFVLGPAAQVAADMVHPTTGWSIKELLQRLNEPPFYIALAGVDPIPRSELAQLVCARTGARMLRDPASRDLQEVRPDPSNDPWEIVLRRELTVLARRQELIASLAALPGDATKTWVVSDFWVNQSLAVARAMDNDSARRRLEAACQTVIRQIPMPKMVLMLVPDSEVFGSDFPQCPPTPDRIQSTARTARYAAELQSLASVPGQGPIVRALSGELSSAQIEVTAAMDAMR
jgi:2-amino-4-hydroxy-6-hydroxymethyldihydropteridine diphosphokinase